jgi:glycosyltransferase involved in cell wall biosynthesis
VTLETQSDRERADAPDDAVAPRVSVILPVFNEVGHLEEEIARVRSGLDASGMTYEVIAVDDGSTDGSADALDRIDGIEVIRFPENHGSGTARRFGTLEARGDVVVWTDVDMTYPNDRIAELVDALEGSDQVVGARTSEQGTMKPLRVPAKTTLRWLASYLTGTKIPDLNSGFRAFRRDVGLQFVDQLPAGFSCVTTMTMTFLANGYSVKYVPIEYGKRAGQSKFHWWADTRRYLLQVVRMVLSYQPLRVFMPLALVLLGLAVAKLVFDWVDRDFRLASNTLLLFFMSLLALTIGILADLIVRVTKPSMTVRPAQAVRRPPRGDAPA